MASASTGPTRPTSKSTEAQTEDLPVFAGLVTLVEEEEREVTEPVEPADQKTSSDSEDRHRWDRRTRQGARAMPPPPVHDRAGPPELPERDPDLLPEIQPERQEDDHHYIFKYADGSQPTHPVNRLYRDLARVRVVDLDLRRGTRAYKAARHGYYYDKINGQRLYLHI